ncbi:MAG: tetratricopeptide repeat protein [Thermoanaerobaculia bacterium]
MASPGWRAVAAATALVAATLGAYRGVAGNDFVVYDDDQYVTANPALRDGLTAPAIRWAFVTDHAANWHPLTWLSHLLDVQLFGFAPRGHHLMSLALHVAATVLLFLLLRRLTGNALPSLATAALFGLHPAHVESVAWVAERKDVLSTLLGLFAIAAYAGWVRRPSWRRYAALVGLFALGLLAKPMLVTLPFVLLLLDLWPLRRWSWKESLAGLVPRVREKLPLFALAAASCSVTFLVQRGGGAVQSADRYPLAIRCQNAAVAYVDYLRQLAWPSDLAVFYPHPGVALSPLRALASLALLLLLTAGAWRLRRSQPAVLVGWLWFLGTLLPVIGLVQVGWQARADRYTYLPSIGLFVALAWGAGALATTPERRTALAAATGAALAACCFVTQAQVGYWRDSETLFLRALAVTRENFLAENNLGHFYNERSRPAEALPHLQEAVRIRPGYGEAHTNLGRALFLLGRVDEAGTQFERANALQPGDPVALNNLAFTRLRQGELAQAERWYRLALERAPDWAELNRQMAVLLLLEERPEEARPHLDRAVDLDPGNPAYRELQAGAAGADPAAIVALRRQLGALHREIALALLRKRRPTAARDHYARAIALDPADAESLNDLGYLLLLDGRWDEAIARLEAAVRLRPDLALARDNLADALRARAAAARVP